MEIKIDEQNIKTVVAQMYMTLFGNGKDGLVKEFRDHREEVRGFRRVWDAREEDKKIYDDRQEKRSQKSYNLMVVAVSILTLIAIAVGSWAAIRALNHQSILNLDSNSQMVQDADWRIK